MPIEREGCYPPKLKAKVDNSSHHGKAKFNNRLLFIQNILKFSTRLRPC